MTPAVEMINVNQVITLSNIARRRARLIDRYFKHVSIIVYKRKVIAIGTNKIKSDTKAQMYRYANPHSELDAYHRVPYNLRSKKLILYNFRFNNNYDIMSSKPCNICMGWCSEVFHAIYHT
jgi:tRNA(Arg) A34 adenosine deaminase TadA